MAAFDRTAAATSLFEALRAAGPTRADSLARMEAVAFLLDNAIVIPGTNRRIGLDAIIGLVPVAGDLVTSLLSAYIVWEAKQLGLPKHVLARMLLNVGIDTAIGAIPVVGDVFDAFFKSNQRNVRLVRRHLEKAGVQTRSPGRPTGPRVIDGTAVRIEG